MFVVVVVVVLVFYFSFFMRLNIVFTRWRSIVKEVGIDSEDEM